MSVPKKSKARVELEIRSPFGGDVKIYEEGSDDDPGAVREGPVTGE